MEITAETNRRRAGQAVGGYTREGREGMILDSIVILSLLVSFFWVQGFNTTEIAKACPGAQCHFAFYGGKSLYHQYITTFQLLNLFVFLWLINFVIALGQCALAGAFASYYWALKKPDDIPPYPLFTAFGRAIR